MLTAYFHRLLTRSSKPSTSKKDAEPVSLSEVRSRKSRIPKLKDITDSSALSERETSPTLPSPAPASPATSAPGSPTNRRRSFFESREAVASLLAKMRTSKARHPATEVLQAGAMSEGHLSQSSGASLTGSEREWMSRGHVGGEHDR